MVNLLLWTVSHRNHHINAKCMLWRGTENWLEGWYKGYEKLRQCTKSDYSSWKVSDSRDPLVTFVSKWLCGKRIKQLLLACPTHVEFPNRWLVLAISTRTEPGNVPVSIMNIYLVLNLWYFLKYKKIIEFKLATFLIELSLLDHFSFIRYIFWECICYFSVSSYVLIVLI